MMLIATRPPRRGCFLTRARHCRANRLATRPPERTISERPRGCGCIGASKGTFAQSCRSCCCPPIIRPASFGSKARLQKFEVEAKEQVARLRQEFDNDSGAASKQEQAARARAARERLERVQHALAELDKVAQAREARKKGDGATARASTTDPQARRMKMPDGGTRPAYNAQLATDTASGIIVGVDIVNEGVD